MFFLVKHMRSLSQNKTVNSVMMSLFVALTVNTAACYNGHMSILPDKEIIIDLIFYVTVSNAGRNINFLPLGT